MHKKFNISDLKETLFYYDKYGMILPVFTDSINNTFVSELVRDNYVKEEISEKIRLFYVGLTRAREKMIIVTHLDYNEEPFNDLVKLKYMSFRDILNSIYSVVEPCIKNVDVNIDTNYKDLINLDISNYLKDVTDDIIDKEIAITYNELESSHFSKSNKEVISKSENKNLEIGTKIHYILEMIDFRKPNYSIIDSKYVEFIKSFLDSELMQDLNCKIYKEYEFKYSLDLVEYHGFIDLMMEYDDYINIIDYKLKNTSDLAYIKQLDGYKKYIESITGKKVYTYLYSILDKKVVDMNSVKV